MGKPGPRELALRDMREARTKGKPPGRNKSKAKEAVAAGVNDAEAELPADVAKETEMALEPIQDQSDEKKDVSTMPKRKTKSKNGKAKEAKKKPSNGNGVRAGSKASKVAEMLLRPQGCTNKEVLKATGWPTVSMPAQAAMAGLKLRKEKTDGGLRYYGSAK